MNFNDYARASTRDPLLTPAEEITCGNAVQAMLPLLKLNPSELTQPQKKIILQGKRAKERLIRGNLRLVINVAKKLHFRGNLRHMYLDDLCQEGAIGLARAAEKFDPKRGYKFSTYAYWWIRQAIMRGIQTQERTVRIPINMLDTVAKVQKYVDKIQVSEDRLPSMEECATQCGVNIDMLRPALNAYMRPSSLDALCNSEEGSALIDLIADETQVEKAVSSDWIGMWEDAQMALKRMPRDYVECLEHHYGLNGKPCMTLAATAKNEGVSREAIRQRVVRASNRMRVCMGVA